MDFSLPDKTFWGSFVRIGSNFQRETNQYLRLKSSLTQIKCSWAFHLPTQKLPLHSLQSQLDQDFFTVSEQRETPSSF